MRRIALLLLAGLAPAASLRALVRVPHFAATAVSPRAAVFAAADSDNDEIMYAAGLSVARSLGELQTLLTKDELAIVGGAIAAKLVGEERADFDLLKWGPKVEALLGERQAAIGEKSVASGKEMLEKAGKASGAKVTDSGLVYLETQAGTGKPAAPGTQVTAHYTGTLGDGTVFDSSVTRGEPLTFPLEGVIQGWQEGLALMKEGGKATLTIPPELGYGDSPQGVIPAGSVLAFDVELIKVADKA